MSKKLSSAFIAVFLLLFIMPSIIFYFFEDYLDRTSSEQRTMAEKPMFSLATIRDYPSEFESYYNDHTAFRTQMIEANSMIDYYIFKSSLISKVLIGKDNWLFYNPAGADGDPMADFYGVNLYSPEMLHEVAVRLVSTRDALRAEGKEFVVFIAPNKASIYGVDFLPWGYAKDHSYTRADQVVDYLTEYTDLTVVYPKTELLTMIEKYPEYIFYYKTDTHWNELGAYIGARELLEALSIHIPPLESIEITQTHNVPGDLSNMMSLPSYSRYNNGYSISGYSSDSIVSPVFVDEGGNIHSFTATNTNPKSIFVIRDSFAAGMMPYLSSQFHSSYFIHRDKYTPGLVKQIPSDIVVFQVVERYLNSLSAISIT